MKQSIYAVLIRLFLVVLALALSPLTWAATDVFFTETFDNAASLPTRWSGATIATETHGSGLALKVDNGSVVKTTLLQASLTASNVAGRRVVVSGQVKAANISTRPQWYNGVKALLVFTLADGSTAYSNQAIVTDGTFDWMNFCFPVTVPSNVTAVVIQVGLEKVSGTAWFDELRVDADPAIFQETFDDTASISSRWSGAAYTTVSHDSGSALQITNTNANTTTVVSTTLPVTAYNGHRLLLTGQVKATGVSDKPQSWNGIKVMITYTTADGQTQYPQADIDVGTFDWTHVYAVVVLPSNVTSITLTIGLEKVTGTVAFDNLGIETAPMLYSEYFDDAGVSSRWTGNYSLITHGTGQAMEVTNTDPSVSNRITISLPYASFRGRQITLQALVKATSVSNPPYSWNGVKVMLTYATPDGVYSYPQLTIGTGTFDWTKFHGQIKIPANITSLALTLGLEKSSGTVDFDEVVIKTDSFSPYWVNPTPYFNGHSVARLRGTMVSTDMTAADLSVLASWNSNLVRWQLGQCSYPNGLNTANFDTVLSNELAKFDALLPSLDSDGIAVTLDLHSLSTHQFDSATNQKKLIDTWRTLAARYKNGGTNSYSGAIWGYDINNEPHDDAWTENLLTLSELSEQVAFAIREIDPTKAIIIEPYNADTGCIVDLRPARTNNVVYSVHYYNPWTYVAQGGSDLNQPYTPITYPGTIDGATWNSAKMRSNVQPTVDFQTQYQVSIYVGEFSVSRWAPGGATFLSDCVNLWESLGWDWSYHAFREWEGWDLEIPSTDPRTSTTRSTTPTDRQIVIRNAFSTNVLPAP